jgi:mannonate dehydratase
MGMRLAFGLSQFGRNSEVDEDERLRLAAQIGVKGVRLGAPGLPGDTRWESHDLASLRRRIEAYGLRIEGIEGIPLWFMDKAMLGLPGTDEQIENCRYTTRDVGRAGIPILGYHWMPSHAWRTEPSAATRGVIGD